MAIASGKGMAVSLAEQRGPAHAILFGEDQARYILAVAADIADFVRANAEAQGIPFRSLGHVEGDRLQVDDLIDLPVADRGSTHESRSEERRVGQECVRTCRSRGSPYHSKKNKHKTSKRT